VVDCVIAITNMTCEMWPIATDVVVVVCGLATDKHDTRCGLLLQTSCGGLCVWHTGEPAKNGRTDENAVWDGQSCLDPRNLALDGGPDPHMGRSTFKG